MKNKRLLILIIVLTTLLSSCLSVQIYEGKVVVMKKSYDSNLNDSVMVYGKVLSAIDETALYGSESRIWVTEKETYSDKYTGEYSIKLLAGEYDLNCLGAHRDESEILVANDIVLEKNEKIEINFYLEGVIE